MQESPPLTENWREFFPLGQIRPKQEKALDYVYRMIAQGVTDIIVGAPTGAGKSVIGAALAFWAGQNPFPLPGAAGAYYLVTQKLLQDQLETDITRYPPHLQSATSLKTAGEYMCPAFKNCGVGLARKPPCSKAFKKGENKATCTYKTQVDSFTRSAMAITNYPYFFTERTYVGAFQPRRLMVMDECHTVEGQLMNFVEVILGPEQMDKYLAVQITVPKLTHFHEFQAWLDTEYLPRLDKRLESFGENLTPERARELAELRAHAGKIVRALELFETDPKNWIYWQEAEDGKLVGHENYTCIAKPLDVSPFFSEMFIDKGAAVRIYMSAYTGPKDVFCRALGLDTAKTAMLSLGSVFPKENRMVHLTTIGSMSRANVQATMPSFMRMLLKILDEHAGEKGIIHGTSYALCKSIMEALKNNPHGRRILYATKAEERESVYKRHREATTPTVILSPSFTEGFDFADDAARWQVIAKVPYPYLGDRQIAAKKAADPEWYAMRAVSTVIQSSGRACRSETDHSVTYVLDSDFDILWNRFGYLFPKWWSESVKRY